MSWYNAGRDEYKPTFFDKHGPDAADRLRVVYWLIIPVGAGGGIGGALAVRRGYTPSMIRLWTWFFAMGISRGAGKAFASFIQPSGATTPYERQYSQEDTLVMRGDVEGALASYEAIIAEAPLDAQPRLRAAELYAKSGMQDRAELLYRAVQRIPKIAAKDDIFASNRLVDLYLAWPGHETKGLRELRRLIDTYPETDVAERARAGLLTLKSQLGVTE
jgi:hypothetical protein